MEDKDNFSKVCLCTLILVLTLGDKSRSPLAGVGMGMSSKEKFNYHIVIDRTMSSKMYMLKYLSPSSSECDCIWR